MSQNEGKNKRTGLVISIVFHSLLVLIFAFYGLTYLDPPPEEEGITINFGTSNDGMVSELNNAPNEAENIPTETEVTEPDPVETVEEEIITQNIEEAPSVDQKKEEKKEVVEPVEKKEEPKPNKKLLNALNKLKNKQTEQRGGDGITGKQGDQGDINGDPNSKNYVGAGSGNGISFNLSGRSMKNAPKINDNSQEEGTVVVDIIVDKYGKVLRANPGARGSNTTSGILYKKAREAALKAKFNANPDIAEEQKGTMTFVFILN
ncbi:MAG: energy transducer TonB [Flavobacteriales bacterium]|nr:energy transducer TonB [Flavobacteriales bacterium]